MQANEPICATRSQKKIRVLILKISFSRSHSNLLSLHLSFCWFKLCLTYLRSYQNVAAQYPHCIHLWNGKKLFRLHSWCLYTRKQISLSTQQKPSYGPHEGLSQPRQFLTKCNLNILMDIRRKATWLIYITDSGYPGKEVQTCFLISYPGHLNR